MTNLCLEKQRNAIQYSLNAIHFKAKRWNDEQLLRLLKYVSDGEVRLYPFICVYKHRPYETDGHWANRYTPTNTAGLCFRKSKAIYINVEVLKNNHESLDSTIVHELAHFDNRNRGNSRLGDEIRAIQAERRYKNDGKEDPVDGEEVRDEITVMAMERRDIMQNPISLQKYSPEELEAMDKSVEWKMKMND